MVLSRPRSLATALLASWLTCVTAIAAEPPPSANFDSSAFLRKYCFECHAGEKPDGKLRLDEALEVNGKTVAHLRKATEKLEAREMPPKEAPRPTDEEAAAFVHWVKAGIAAHEAARRETEGRVVLRRLNRVEYENTIRDLLGIKADLKELLPLDTPAHGFDNVGEALHVSSFLMDRYLEAADTALNLAIASEPQPPRADKRYRLQDERPVKMQSENVYRVSEDATVLFSSSPWSALHLWQFYPPHRGTYRFRISTYAVQSNGKPVTFRVDGGPMLMGTKNHLIGYFDAPADKPTIIEFVDDLEARNHIRISPYAIGTAFDVTKAGGAEKYEGPGLAIEWVEVEGPLHDSWPPESHRRIFGDLPREKVKNRLQVVSNEPRHDAERILRDFAARAFRRQVTDDDVRPFLELVEERLAAGESFEQAMRVGLTGVLLSPDFLFLREKPGKLDDYALASRLSYFLWSSMPDAELLALAADGKLSDAATLRAQTERMLKDPKASALTVNFTDQWLGLREINATEPDRLLYPEFDDMLRVAMVEETHRFFAELLREDLSIANFIASDFSILNARLAKHYGIEGVDGWEFRKVALPPGSHRGGVLTMASVMKVTANGTTTSPVVRGAWVLDRVLGTPPSPPPAGVPAVEPDIRGATTIRDQLAKHRQVESCASCHVRIDPPGFALESFDVIGGWRDNYRTRGRGEPVEIDNKRMPYLKGPAVDSADALADGRPFADIDQFKALLLADKDQVARALAARLLTYATGHPPEAADQRELAEIVKRLRAEHDGLRSLVHAIVQSDAFQHK